ncbi:MAG: DUF1592 domain-containing protein, partial [Nannocystaceae bacterium]
MLGEDPSIAWARAAVAVGFAALVGACSGGEPDDAPAVPPVELRRLSHFEYSNAVDDLLGLDVRPGDVFPSDPHALGFDDIAVALQPSPLLIEAYMVAAEQLSTAATADLSALVPCSDDGDELACARSFIRGFARRAYHRELDLVEEQALLAAFAQGRAAADFREGIRRVIERVLQSPYFLYRVEFGEPQEEDAPSRRLTPWELAARLSFFLWGSVPDDALLDAARDGALETAADVEAQAWRMLEEPRAHAMVAHFHHQWLELERIEDAVKSSAALPGYLPALRGRMVAETERFVDHVLWDGEGDLTTLLTARYSFVDGPLAELYGVPGVSGDALVRVELDPSQRAGLVTHASVLAGLATPSESSPIRRGKFIRDRLLCDPPSPPPGSLDISLPAPDPDATTRERFAQHTAAEPCASCHARIDPIGFGLEGYDA